MPKTKANANFKVNETRNFIMSVSSDDGKSNPQIHIPVINSIVKLGPKAKILQYEYILIFTNCKFLVK